MTLHPLKASLNKQKSIYVYCALGQLEHLVQDTSNGTIFMPEWQDSGLCWTQRT